MLEQIEKPNGKLSIQDAVNFVGRAAKTKIDADEWKAKAEHLYEDTIDETRRLAKKAKYATEDLIDDTEHMIKKEPFKAVGVTFGVGIGLGMLAGWMFGKMIHHCKNEAEH
ncbi:MAG: hypothetical protein QUS14_18345 [Pyrinomonadaceae bacterium]|nr:hypothetical protein [Pyrinomonadaceae bacterium]